MADLSSAVSSFLKRLKFKPRPSSGPGQDTPPPENLADRSPEEEQAALRSLNSEQLADFISRHAEREAVRILQSLTDQELQGRLVRAITDEATLKRIVRSQFDKKIKRLAEKQLRETGTAVQLQRRQNLIRLTEQIQAFLDDPEWSDADELLRIAIDHEVPEASDEIMNAAVAHFTALRTRLKGAVEAYNSTCAEMEEICGQVGIVPYSALPQLQSRWNDLEEKYSFPENHPVISNYREALKLRSRARSAEAPKVPEPKRRESKNERQEVQDRKNREKQLKARQSRLEAMEAILSGLHRLSENLAHPQAGTRFRNLQNELHELRRWKSEYPLKLEEAEALLKAILSKRTQVLDEAKWDAWARTDRAARIQLGLEELIRGFEEEQDQEAALGRAAGLTQRLFDAAKEMRELGHLERDKDHQLWDQFKALNERARLVCNKIGLFTLEKLKAELSQHASQPIEFTTAVLGRSNAMVQFKTSGFAEDVSARMEKLQMLWCEFGPRTFEMEREMEAIMKKLLETYFRQRNLHRGQLQRAESNAIHETRELLREMKIACEGKSTLVSRTGVAKKLEEKWKRHPLPATVGDLQKEFESYQIRLNAELAEETRKQLDLVLGVQTRARALLDKILTQDGAAISQILNSISGLEAELQVIKKYLGQLKPLKQAVVGSPDAEELERSFDASAVETQGIFQQVRAAAQKETAERASKRNQVLLEAERLALSMEWETAGARFEELKALWKKVGNLGSTQDALFHFVFENVSRFYLTRFENRERVYTPNERAAALKVRNELLCSLEALNRLARSSAAAQPLPVLEGENADAFGKLLEFGLKYKQVLSLDPKDGAIKETKKVMTDWARHHAPDHEHLEVVWRAYLERVHALFEMHVG